jgi:hypothetical protein
VNASLDAAQFISWLYAHQVPKGTCVILDLEIAVDAPYVNVFNTELRAAGYKVTKYGSQNYIWENPKTDGGTYVALPGPNVLSTEGDTVARQYAFDGGYDLSIVEDQAVLPLWDARPPVPVGPPYAHYTDGVTKLADIAASRNMTVTSFLAEQGRQYAAQTAALAALAAVVPPKGIAWFTDSP